MTHRSRTIVVAVIVLPALICRGLATADPRPPSAPAEAGQEPAASGPRPNPYNDMTTLITDPDRFAWELFVYVNAKASPDSGSNAALWEDWADDILTFPSSPDPKKPPKWPDGARPRSPAEFRQSLQLRSKVEGQRLRRLNDVRKAQGHAPVGSPRTIVNPSDPQAGFIAGVLEQVTRNRPAFEYIIKNHLWYTQGIAARVQPSQPPIALPRDSIMIKAEWKVLGKGEDRTRYHWEVDDQGTAYGLVGLHITSKSIPNWVWATFEWVDNPGRSDYIGSRDAFGVKYPVPTNPSGGTPTFQAPNPQLGSIYPAGTLTPRLEALFARAFGDDPAWIAQWRHYRLKGTQVDFTDGTGRPTLLGNTVSENGFVATSSCMTCHARASVEVRGPGAGRPQFPGGFAPSVNNAGNVSYNGAPDPTWYFTTPGIAGGILSGPANNVQTDFVWGIPFASPAPSATSP